MLFLYGCTECQYTAEISGGHDANRGRRTDTVTCHDCKELYDVVSYRIIDENYSFWKQLYHSFRKFPYHDHLEAVPLKCSKSPIHQVTLWVPGSLEEREWDRHRTGPCPVCGAQMEQREVRAKTD